MSVFANEKRRDLIRRWHDRLVEARRLAETGVGYRRWIGQMHQRVFRFLISAYGNGQWNTTPAETESGDADDVNSRLVDCTEGLQGTPPKSEHRIRKTLKHIHSANEQAAATGTAQGLLADDWIILETFASRKHARLILGRLRRYGVGARLACQRRREHVVWVRQRQRRLALKTVEQFRSESPLFAMNDSDLRHRPGAFRAIFSNTFWAIFILITLVNIGLAVGLHNASHIAESSQAAYTYAAFIVWFVVSVFLFCGLWLHIRRN